MPSCDNDVVITWHISMLSDALLFMLKLLVKSVAGLIKYKLL